MKAITALLTALALCTATVALADDVIIPTSDDHPFDLTLGELTGKGMKVNDQGELQDMHNGARATYILDNRDDGVPYYQLSFKAGTQRSDAMLRWTITTADGDTVTYRNVGLVNNGSWTATEVYSLKTDKMVKGKYTLTIDFISSGNNWVCRLADINIKKPMKLKPNDEVTIANPEFDDGNNGWTYKNINSGVKDMFGNRCNVIWLKGGTCSMSQSVVGLPDGIYLLLASAFDDARSWNGTDTLQTYLFLNDTYQPMKTAYDDAVGYRNIYRISDGQQQNNSYRRTPDARYVPKAGLQWNECLAMAEGLYVNAVAAPVTDGKASFGWIKTDNHNSDLACDHFRLVYLTDDITLSAEAQAALISEYITATYNIQLTERKQAISNELKAKRAHAPQAVAEANDILGTDEHRLTRNEQIDAIIHASHVLQRLALPFHDITVPDGSPSGLADLIAARGIEANDTIALKLSGTLDDSSLTALKTLKNLKELDLSETTLTTLPKSLFEGRQYLLTWLTLPRQLETIGERAFWDCYSLCDMALPATLTTIGNYAFRNCYSLDRVIIPENVSVGSSAYTGTGVRSISFPSSLKTVPELICYECPDLVNIQFNGQTEIGSRAFSRCNALLKVAVPEGVEKLGQGAFEQCNQLATATLPSTLIYENSPFYRCSMLKDVTIMAACPPYGGLFDLAADVGHSDAMESVTVRVPRLSLDAYRESIYAWQDATLIPIDSLPQTFTMNGAYTLNVPDNLPADYKPNVDLSMMVGYPNAGASEVTTLQTKACLTVNGSSMFSTDHYRQLYSPYAVRSAYYHKPDWRAPLYTTLVNNGQMRADEVTINLQLYKNKWDFICFPFDVRVGDISCANGAMPLIIYGYDAKKRAEGTGQAWVLMTADSILHAGQGYIWQTGIPMNEQRALPYNTFYVNALQNTNKPKFFRNGDVEVTLKKHNAEFAQNRSWNFIGNPYPCFFDIRAIDTTAPIIIWDFNKKSNGNYQALSPLDDDYVLYPGQAFFIQCPFDQDRLVFLKEGRQHDLELQYQASRNEARSTASAQHRQVFNLLLAGYSGKPGEPGESGESGEPGYSGHSGKSGTPTPLDRARFVINEAASLDYEPGRDANKFTPLDAGTAQFYTLRDGIRYAIDERPLADGTVRLGLQLPTDGTYTISLAPAPAPVPAPVPAGSPAGTVTLIDRETGTETDLTADSYTFQAEAGTFDNRFLVRLAGAPNAVQSVVALPQQTQQLYDLQGRPVSSPLPGIYVRNNKKVIIK